MTRPAITRKKREEFAYHLNCDPDWFTDPKNQKLIRRMIQAACRYMEKKYKKRSRAGKRGRDE